jgi:hypothetical protein
LTLPALALLRATQLQLLAAHLPQQQQQQPPFTLLCRLGLASPGAAATAEDLLALRQHVAVQLRQACGSKQQQIAAVIRVL